MCKRKLILQRLLAKLNKNSVFSVIDKFVRRIEACPVGGVIAVTVSSIHVKIMGKYCASLVKLYEQKFMTL